MNTNKPNHHKSSSVDLQPANNSKYPNRNIKERLNLHVKRRLQETVAEPTTPPAIGQSSFASTNPIAMVTTKRGAASERGTTAAGTSHSGRGGKRPRATKQATSSVSSTSSICADDECSRDGTATSNGIETGREKDRSPDILTMVLNQKKLSLFRDPEVVKFLGNIATIIGMKTEEGCGQSVN